MASSTEIFLKWNGHHDALVPMLYSQLQKKNFVDVTIRAEGKSVNAHRLILCAASEYFEGLFEQNHQLAVVTLQNMKFCDVQSIIEYVYKGEVSLPREQLGSFMAIATFLKIKGLAEKEDNPDQSQESVEMTTAPADPDHQMILETHENLDHPEPLDHGDPDLIMVDQPPRPAPVIINVEESDDEGENDEENSDSDSSSNSSSSSDSSSSDDEEEDPKEGSSAVASKPKKSSTQRQNANGNKADSSLNKTRFNCDRCGKGFGCKKYLVKHTLTVNCQVAPWFRCALCGKCLKKRICCKRHLSSVHNHNVASSQFMDYFIEPDLTCSVCSYRCKTLINLQKHMKFYHS